MGFQAGGSRVRALSSLSAPHRRASRYGSPGLQHFTASPGWLTWPSPPTTPRWAPGFGVFRVLGFRAVGFWGCGVSGGGLQGLSAVQPACTPQKGVSVRISWLGAVVRASGSPCPGQTRVAEAVRRFKLGVSGASLAGHGRRTPVDVCRPVRSGGSSNAMNQMGTHRVKK